MAKYYYRPRWYYRRRPRRYIRKWFKRRFRRFINGSSKSSIRVKIPISTTFTLSTSNAGTVKALPFSPFVNSASDGSALSSPLYRLYTQLYDEVKCIGGRITLAIGTPIGTATVPSLTIITAWDRRLGRGTLERPTDFATLENYSSQKKAVAVNNSIAKLIRSCYASDIMEKAQWHDCTLSTPSAGLYQDDAFTDANNNPNFFNPGMWLGASISNATAQTITFQADITWYFSFRNPKYGGSAGDAAKQLEDMDIDGQLDQEDDTPLLKTGGGKVERGSYKSVTAVGDMDTWRAKRRAPRALATP